MKKHDKDKDASIGRLSKSTTVTRDELNRLIRELQDDERKLRTARERYSALGKALDDFNAEVEKRRGDARALKEDLKLHGPSIERLSKRAFERAPFTLHVNFGGLAQPYSGFAINVSPGGMLVATCDPPPLGVRFAAEFNLDAQRTVRAAVEVVWTQVIEGPDKTGRRVSEVGLRFLSLTPDDKAALQRFAEAL